MLNNILEKFSTLLVVWVVQAAAVPDAMAAGVMSYLAEAAITNALFATWCIVSAALLAGIWSAKKQP